MFKRPSKKQQLLQRVFIYSTMTVAVLVIVTGAVLFVLGYRIDGQRGSLEQGLLVQFDSTPSGAAISIDGEPTGMRTADKRTILAGEHNFTMTRDGYQPWSKTLNLQAGTLNWLDYIRLVPIELPPENVLSFQSVVDEKAAPDLKTILIQEKADTPTFRLVDLRSKEVKSSTITLPGSVYSESADKKIRHAFLLEKWDTSGRHMLLRHTYDEKSEWIVMDTQDISRSENITRLLGINLSDIQFAGTSGTQLFGLSDGVVRKLDLANQTISRALISNVTSFSMFETNIITYVGKDSSDSKKRVVGVYRDGDQSATVLRTVDSASIPLRIATTRFFTDNYVAISEGMKVTILKGNYPTSSKTDTSGMAKFAEFTTTAPVDTLSFSPSGDYVVAGYGVGFSAYELEYGRVWQSSVNTKQAKAQPLQWLDDAYLWVVYDGQLSIREFDGSNVHYISQAMAGTDVTLSVNGRYIYSMVESDGTYYLQRVTMILG